VSAICACQSGMADAVLSTTRESEVARGAFQEPTTALARIPAVAANVEYVLTEIAWSISMGTTMEICASFASGPSFELVMPITVTPLLRTLVSN